ncbi:hypothetical protein AB7942_29435 [Neobacillus sp. BF23-41]|uniref:hypothetical protein n=1 Tax=Neobacillus sp. BF23-41 TaxID=3240280 RepID=UPI0034E53749
MKKKFEYNEIVEIVNSSNPKLKEAINKKGYIAGDAFDENTGKWIYAVFIFDNEIVYSCDEDNLKSTGEYFQEDEY